MNPQQDAKLQVNPHELAGFVSLTADWPTFLIPYFKNNASNEIFVQDLDQDFCIKRFQRFRPDDFTEADFHPAPIIRDIGQLGLLAVATGDGRLLYGSPMTLRRKLQSSHSFDGDDPFFDLEASMFLEDSEEFEKALKNAVARSPTSKALKVWSELERSIAGRLKSNDVVRYERSVRPPAFAEAINSKLLPGQYREAILGDLEEAFNSDVARYGLSRARRLYLARSIGSLAPIAQRAMEFGLLGAMSGQISALIRAVSNYLAK